MFKWYIFSIRQVIIDFPPISPQCLDLVWFRFSMFKSYWSALYNQTHDFQTYNYFIDVTQLCATVLHIQFPEITNAMPLRESSISG